MGEPTSDMSDMPGNPDNDPFAGLDDGAVSNEDYVAARDAFVEAHVAHRRAKMAEKKASVAKTAAAERLNEMMALRGETEVRLDNGILIKKKSATKWGYDKAKREEMLEWAPVEYHSVNTSGKTGGTFATVCSEFIKTHGEEALPSWVQRVELKEIAAYNVSKVYTDLKQ